ncbi:very short patch repair endonuclease [Nitrosarchaeum sp.]|nr:very short patch repair endonuclease [Nitrosarchaeum sp.]
MTDIFTPEKRSWVMSQIRGRDTKIEKKMRQILLENRIKFVQHPQMFGNPDFVVGKHTVLFCDGDFWHGYNYEKKKKPAKKFWKDKIERNMRRDRKVAKKLRREGYSVLRFWEHDIEKRPEMCVRKIKRFIR